MDEGKLNMGRNQFPAASYICCNCKAIYYSGPLALVVVNLFVFGHVVPQFDSRTLQIFVAALLKGRPGDTSQTYTLINDPAWFGVMCTVSELAFDGSLS